MPSYKRTHYGTVKAGSKSTGYKKPFLQAAGAVGLGALVKAVNTLTHKEYEKPSNSDTNINLNSSFNATSLYSKTRRKRKRLPYAVKSRRNKARSFKKRVVKAIRKKLAPISTVTLNRGASTHIGSVPQFSTSVQDVWGLGAADFAFVLAPGQLVDATGGDITAIGQSLNAIGHVENGVAVSGANYEKIKFWYHGTSEFTMLNSSPEFNDSNPLYLDIYEMVAVKNIANPALKTPGLAWQALHVQNGDTYGGGGGYTVDTPASRGNTPSMCPDMNKWWKTVKVTRVRIASGAPFVYKFSTSGVWSPYRAQNYYAIGGQTKGIVIVAASVMSQFAPAIYNFDFTGINKHFKYREIVGLGKDPQNDCKNSRLLY